MGRKGKRKREIWLLLQEANERFCFSKDRKWSKGKGLLGRCLSYVIRFPNFIVSFTVIIQGEFHLLEEY